MTRAQIAEKRRRVAIYGEEYPDASSEQIASAVGASAWVVAKVLNEAGLTRKRGRKPAIDYAAVAAYVAEHPAATCPDVARALGYTAYTWTSVYKAVRAARDSPRPEAKLKRVKIADGCYGVAIRWYKLDGVEVADVKGDAGTMLYGIIPMESE